MERDVTAAGPDGLRHPTRAVPMFDASRKDPGIPADTPVSEDPPPISIEVFGREPLADDLAAEDDPSEPAPTTTTAGDRTPSGESASGGRPAPGASPSPGQPVGTADAATPSLGRRTRDDGLAQMVETRIGGLEQQIQDMAKQASFLPRKLRGLGDKLGDLAAPLSDARSRALMTDLLMIDDLVRSGLACEDDVAAAQRTLGAVGQLMGSVLEQHGVSEIGTEGRFDPTVHQAVQQLPVDDPEHDGEILEVYRRGLRTEQRVLRYAEVGVARYQAPLHDDIDGELVATDDGPPWDGDPDDGPTALDPTPTDDTARDDDDDDDSPTDT